jgi:hypothetical protein
VLFVTFRYLRIPTASAFAGVQRAIIQREELERVQIFQIPEARPSSAHSFDGFFHEHHADLSMYTETPLGRYRQVRAGAGGAGGGAAWRIGEK